MKVLDLQSFHILDKSVKKTNLDFFYEKLEQEETTAIYEHGVVKALIEIKWAMIMKRILWL